MKEYDKYLKLLKEKYWVKRIHLPPCFSTDKGTLRIRSLNCSISD